MRTFSISVITLTLASAAPTAFAQPVTLTQILSTRDHKTSAGIERNVVKLAADMGGTQIHCSAKSKDADQQYLNFGFKVQKISKTKVNVTVTTTDDDNTIAFGGAGIIELTAGAEFSQLLIGDDGRRVITFATPGKNFEMWGAGPHGVCEDVSVAAYFDGFGPADVAECCADIKK